MSEKAEERPAFCKEKHLTYLDDLRESGETNMFGAGRYLDEEFPELRDGVVSFNSSPKARKILSYWMATFSERQKGKESA